MKTSLSLLALTLVTACSSVPASDTAVTAQGTEPTPDLSGTYAFELDASDVAAPVRAKCANDPQGQDACFAAVRDDASNEKIRFVRDGAGRTVWSSFATDGTREELFLEVPVELAADGPGRLLAKVAGPAKGPQAAGLPSSVVMQIEIIDARTIAMIHPTKGRLVYGKE